MEGGGCGARLEMEGGGDGRIGAQGGGGGVRLKMEGR